MEVFCIDPDTGEDPLSDYFNGAMGFIGGGLRGEQDLSRKLYPINLELNEWKSLPPGSYRLCIVSHRATGPTDNDPYGMGTTAFLVLRTLAYTLHNVCDSRRRHGCGSAGCEHRS
jgi:hypothetical protein